MALQDIEIIKYNPDYKKVWNEFVESSKNGTFLFNRDYMDYHSDRFQDNSLLFYRKGKLYCMLPANRRDDILYSHQGLTYGGLIMNNKCTAEGILDVFDVLMAYMKDSGIKKLIYKPIPHIYHIYPAEEDLYALFRNDAKLIIRNISSSILLSSPLKFSQGRRTATNKAENMGLRIMATNDLESFWNILNNNLQNKYNVKPVHSLSEMKKLAIAFPNNIRLYAAFKDSEMFGGVLCYISKNVIHSQYISASSEGKEAGAIDAIIKFLIDKFSHKIHYFDFGISNEDRGRYLNGKLIFQKEGFGGRGVCYDTYELNI